MSINQNPGKKDIIGSLSLSQLSEQIRELKTKIPVFVSIHSINCGEPFISLFPIQERNLESIVNSIKTNGFDVNKALVVGLFPDGKSYLVDGHTRLQALKELEIDQVPIWYQNFTCIDDAIDWALHEQIDRRNLSEADLFEFMLRVDHKTGKGKKVRGYQGKSAQRTADIIGTSVRKVEQMRTVNQNGSLDQKQSIRDKKKSINKVYQEIRSPKKKSCKEKAVLKEKVDKEYDIQVSVSEIVWITNGKRITLVDFKPMELLFPGAPSENIRKVIQEHLDNI